MSQELEVLEQRIRRLESQNRRLKWLGGLVLALALTTAARGQKTGTIVTQAHKFELRDDAGHLRAELAMLNGEPALRFFDQDASVQALLAGDSFNIFKKGGASQVVFAFNGLSFENGNEKEFVRLSAYGQDQMGKLQINDYRHKIYTVITAEDLAKIADKSRQGKIAP